jgi:N-acetylmuramoyl-L-alanine amidase
MSNVQPPAGPELEEEFDLEALLASPAEEHGTDHSTAPGDEEAAETEAGGIPQPQPLAAVCKRDFKAQRTQGSRAVSQIRLIIIHSTESHSARSSANWFANPNSKGSAHILVDDNECYRTLDDTVIPWGAPGANTHGFHVEHTGFAAWDRAKWMSHEQTLRRGAFKSAIHAVKFGIPIQLLNVADLKNGRSGFATHATVSKFHPPKKGGGHTDPGAGFPLDHYMELVEQFATEIDV